MSTTFDEENEGYSPYARGVISIHQDDDPGDIYLRGDPGRAEQAGAGLLVTAAGVFFLAMLGLALGCLGVLKILGY